jgi:lipoyl(octanoyl) transferase
VLLEGYWLDLGLIPYAPAFAIQAQVLQARMEGRLPATIILQENPPTFTIGRSGSRANILASPDELARRGIEVLEVNRGGDVTYHGPGQLIASPLLYLGDVDLNANQYLHRLEDLLVELLAGYGIQAGKKPSYPGVWVGEEKIGAVGIAVRHGYTFHGFSLNVSLDLTAFNLINPCGVVRMPVTSMERVLGRAVLMAEAKAQLRQVITHTFLMDLQAVTWAALQAIIHPAQKPV